MSEISINPRRPSGIFRIFPRCNDRKYTPERCSHAINRPSSRARCWRSRSSQPSAKRVKSCLAEDGSGLLFAGSQEYCRCPVFPLWEYHAAPTPLSFLRSAWNKGKQGHWRTSACDGKLQKVSIFQFNNLIPKAIRFDNTSAFSQSVVVSDSESPH